MEGIWLVKGPFLIFDLSRSDGGPGGTVEWCVMIASSLAGMTR